MLNRWQRTIVDLRGNVVPYAQLQVRVEATQAAAEIYRDSAGTEVIPNGIVTANAQGYAFFYAPAGLYRITSAEPVIDWRDVNIGSAEALLRSNNLDDLSSASDARSNLGLGTAATRDVGIESGEVILQRVYGASVRKAQGNFASLNSTPHSPDAWNANSKYSLFLDNENNALAVFVSGENNERIASIQVGHASHGYSDALGTLHLNPLGGNVTVNRNTAYHSGNFPPIGFVYTQYPGEASPSDLFGGTWTLLLNTEGVFFRTEGQGASGFGSGVQEDAIRNITGSIRTTAQGTGSQSGIGAFSWQNETASVVHSSFTSSGTPRFTFDASRVVPTASENRPRNITIRVWKKTAN